ncbi:putative bifunctional diguanylate cyclase/phosphodiesterase [Lactobacillus sp.]|uniref:putative bifunctional diguanylate cyclase/phosphodiesterase n=1 Tax=Lactobacillus sp. TaxID=1591 RepID=UPI003F0BE49F
MGNGRPKPDQVISLLDLVKDELGLAMVYVCENTAGGSQFLYQYCSHGDNFSAMHHNLLIAEGQERDTTYELLQQENPVVLTGEYFSNRFAMAAGNLVYSYFSGSICQGLVCFQKEKQAGQVWNEEEKETLTILAKLLWPLVAQDQIAAQVRVISANAGNLSMVWIYPKVKTAIFSKDLRTRFGLSNYYRAKSIGDFCQSFVAYKDQDKVVAAYQKALQGKEMEVSCHAFQHSDKLHLTIVSNRYDFEGQPEQLVVFIRRANEVSKDRLERSKRLEAYREFQLIYSRDNIFELFLDLTQNQATVFKAPLSWQSVLEQGDNYDQLLHLFASQLVLPNSQQPLLNALNCDNLRRQLTQQSSFFLTAHVQVENQQRLLEFEVIEGRSGNHRVPQSAIVVVKDVTDKRVSRYDSLTGLLNMHNFLLEVGQKWQPGGQLLVMNVENFKFYNMRHGLEQGDRCLIEIAELLKELYPGATLARFNADNFYVYDPDPGDWELRIIRLHTRLKRLPLANQLRMRVGVYQYSDKVTASLACDRAKLACDQAKKQPEQSWCLYTPAMQEREELKQYLIDHLDDALRNHYLQVYYQPVIRTLTGRLCSAEALVRWIDPVKGFLSPGDFIPLFEEMNLSYKVDRYVIQEVTKMIREHMDKGWPVIPVSVNLSRADFQMMDPLTELNQAMRKNNLRRSLVHVEITESALSKDVDGLKRAIHNFRQAGYEVWMDDFGSGYSALNYLKNFEFDEIKLDMIFMKDFDEASKKIVTACVKMAKDLGIHTLAEGVETQQQLDFLRSIGCERIQGYYYSKPLPPDKLCQLITEKGIEIENWGQSKFYQQVGLVDLVSDKPICLVLDDGSQFSMLYANEEFQKEIKRSPALFDRIINDWNKPDSATAKQLHAFAKKVGQGGESYFDFKQIGQYLRLSAKQIAKLENYQMLLINPSDITVQYLK